MILTLLFQYPRTRLLLALSSKAVTKVADPSVWHLLLNQTLTALVSIARWFGLKNYLSTPCGGYLDSLKLNL